MPFALLIVGAFLLIAAVRGTVDGPNGLFALVEGEFTGPTNFLYWMVAILIIGALGYIPKAKPVSTAFLGLLIVVLFLAKGDPNAVGGGFFTQFTKGLASTTTATPTASAAGPAASAATPAAAPAPSSGGLTSILSGLGNSVQNGTLSLPGLDSLPNITSMIQ